MSKSVIIAGSPRKGGNSDIMANTALETLTALNIKAEIVYLRELKFSPCIACNACFKTGQCIQKDDLEEVYKKLLNCELIIISAPIYFQSLGAMAKAFIDRSQRFWSQKYIMKKHIIADEELRSKRQIYALLCGGTNFPDTFTCAEKIIKLFGLMLEAKYVGGNFFPLIDEKRDILKEQGNLAKIREGIINLYSQ